MQCRSILSVLLVVVPSLFASGQEPATPMPPSTSQESEIVELEIEQPANIRVSEVLIRHIFRETIEEVRRMLNSNRPPTLQARVTLRLGQPGDTVETIEGKTRHTLICMRKWDEWIFARMVTRVARNGLLTDQELDLCARAALLRARATITAAEMRHKRN